MTWSKNTGGSVSRNNIKSALTAAAFVGAPSGIEEKNQVASAMDAAASLAQHVGKPSDTVYVVIQGTAQMDHLGGPLEGIMVGIGVNAH